MPPGMYPHRFEIQESTETRDAHGGITPTWATIRNRWGRLQETGGRELWRAQQVNPQLTASWTMPYESVLTQGHRIVHDSRTFNVEAVTDPTGKQRETVAMCVEPK